MKFLPGSCAECGASGRFGSCSSLFERLLALDHQRLQPWGTFHGVNVACHRLQHPDGVRPTALGGSWELVRVFLADGFVAANELEARWVRHNRRGQSPALQGPEPPTRIGRPVMSIEDVSVDGSFPAAGYALRMRSWAAAVVGERGHRAG